MVDRARRAGRPIDRWPPTPNAPVAPGSPPRRRRPAPSRWRTASRSSTGCGPGTRTGTRPPGLAGRASGSPRERRRGSRRPTASALPALAHPGRAGPRPGRGRSSTAGSPPGTAPSRTRQVLHAAGFHVLTFDVRGHGANGPETLPAVGRRVRRRCPCGGRLAAARPEVSRVALLGHSMGAPGRWSPRPAIRTIAAVIAVSTPADP